jgi:hypothetical protein
MSSRQAAWLMAMAMLTLLVVFSAPAFPQDTGHPAGAGAQPELSEANAAAVEQILQQQEQLMRGQRFSYEPGARRDPFQSLFIQSVSRSGERAPGLPGMYIDEIDLNGIVQDGSGGDVAYFTGSDNKGYFVRVGDRVYDGAVIAIDPVRGAVTFRQEIDDPRRIKPYRDVVRTLETLEEISHD